MMRRDALVVAMAMMVSGGGWGLWAGSGASGAYAALDESGDIGMISSPGAPGQDPTWVDDVAPILAESCMNCHRPGQVAPMSLLTHEDARPWAPLIRFVVEERIMPPWHADPETSEKFGNDRRLTDEQIETIVRWAQAGAPRGEGEYEPPEFPDDNWLLAAELGPPDFVWQFDEPIRIPPTGPDLWPEVAVPTTHQRDIWIQAAEVRGNARVVHHSTVRVIHPDGSRDPTGRLAAYTPGKQYDRFPAGSGKMIPAGSELRFGLHYNTAGQPEEDVHGVAVWLARDPVQHRIHSSVVADPSLDIPPYEPSYASRGEVAFDRDVEITLMKPHMHWRGNDMLYRAVYPDGEITNLLFISNYDMNWQISYELEEPFPIPAGGKLEVIAHFDNSPENPWNPDPSQRVLWGMDSRDEMMEGWFDYQVRLDEPVVPPTLAEVLSSPPRGSAAAGEADPLGTWTLHTTTLADRPTRGMRPELLRVEEVDGELRAEITSIRNVFVPVEEIDYEDGTLFVRFTAFEYTLQVDDDQIRGEVVSPAGVREVTGFRQEEGVFLYATETEEFETVRTGILGHRTDGRPPDGVDDPAGWVASRLDSVEDVALIVRGSIAVQFSNPRDFEDQLMANLGREADVHGAWVGDRIRIDHIEVEGESAEDH